MKYTVSNLLQKLAKYNQSLTVNVIVINGQECIEGQLSDDSFSEQTDWRSGQPFLEITLE